MLNELYQVAEALERINGVGRESHPYIEPLGNSPLLVAKLNDLGKVCGVDILKPESVSFLKRIKHGAEGTSFPGFNLPSPVWDLAEVPVEDLKLLVETQKNRNATARQRFHCLCALKPFIKFRSFTPKQERQFDKIFGEFVTLLATDFVSAPPELAAFTRLLTILSKNKPSMTGFILQIADQVTQDGQDIDIPTIKAVESFLVGKILFQGISAVGSGEWWEKKKSEDKKGKTPIFVDLYSLPEQARPVAHKMTCELIEAHLLKVRPGRGFAKSGKGSQNREGIDAFTGSLDELETSFREPKVQALRPPKLKLFSASSETPCLNRYGMIESSIFPASKRNAARMQSAILKLAGNKDQRGRTWYPIPSNLNEKRKPKTDLLVAYLENEPEARVNFAEMFGGQPEGFSTADFEAVCEPIFETMEAKLKTTPDLNLRLLVFSSIDPGRKQICLDRRFHVQDVIRAAKDWRAGASNVPPVSLWLDDKKTKRSVLRTSTTPCPLEVASTVNRVWSSDSKTGFAFSFQRALSASDAYDVFIANSPLSRKKTEFALGLLISRMSKPLAALAAAKHKCESLKTNKPTLGDVVRWQSLKAIALFGIFLRQLNQQYSIFMKEPVYQLGQLLALADSLHEQYCKHVRDGKTPTQLIGSSIFNTALEQPVFALARLAERMVPYQAWAKTFKNTDPNVKSGWEKTILRLLRECASRFIEEVDGVFRIRADELPARMTDLDKAKLLLGYLADIQISETEDK